MGRFIKKNRRLKIGLFLLFIVGLAIVSYRYTSKRLEFYGHYDKVWAHRVDDLDKLNSAQNNFSGVEVDLIYISAQNRLKISHDLKDTTSLDLETYVKELKTANLGMWLDIKNLDKDHASAIFKRIEDLSERYPNFNPKNLLVESTEIDALKVFSENHYQTTWYITEIIKAENKEEELKKIKASLASKNTGLSSNYKNYLYLAEAFPETPKHFWMLNSSYDVNIFKNYGLIRGLIKDRSVHTVLIPYINFNRYF